MFFLAKRLFRKHIKSMPPEEINKEFNCLRKFWKYLSDVLFVTKLLVVLYGGSYSKINNKRSLPKYDDGKGTAK